MRSLCPRPGRARDRFVRFVRSSLRLRTALGRRESFPPEALALYRERQVKPGGRRDPLRLTLRPPLPLFAWREALTIVQPATLVRWHREAFRLIWRWRSRSGRPRLPAELQQVIAVMARDNVTWGEERIAAELRVKLGILVSPRTVRQYMDRPGSGGGKPSRTGGQRWATFVWNHAQALVACDFCVVVTATFRVLYVFVASRSAAAACSTSTPRASDAAWTLQQFREIFARAARLSVRPPRSGQHLFTVAGCGRDGHGCPGPPHTSSVADGECLL